MQRGSYREFIMRERLKKLYVNNLARFSLSLSLSLSAGKERDCRVVRNYITPRVAWEHVSSEITSAGFLAFSLSRMSLLQICKCTACRNLSTLLSR